MGLEPRVEQEQPAERITEFGVLTHADTITASKPDVWGRRYAQAIMDEGTTYTWGKAHRTRETSSA